MGLFDSFLGSQKYYLLQQQQPGSSGWYNQMAAERMSYGYKPIDWPKIIANQFRAISLTRPLNIFEQCMYDGALQNVKDAQKIA